ncbi:MAG: hypothetical protein ABIY52_11245 [Gemmatimonadaceae bacterium]
MRTNSIRILAVAAAALALASTSAVAQGNGRSVMQVLRTDGSNSRDVQRDRETVKRERKEAERRQKEVDRARREQDRVYRHEDNDRNDDRYNDGRRVPPGLAKKPGHMPPGQYKKRYDTRRYEPSQGASVLGTILGRNGYSVLRTTQRDGSQYVDYRARDGQVRRAMVSPGGDRLSFSNVPQSILQQVLSALY